MTMLTYILTTITIFLAFLFLHDIFQKKHSVTRNFPIIGHFRYLFESIGPELRQYWVANDKEEMPFTRSERSWVYATSKKQNNNFGFGTSEQLYEAGYPILKHSTFPYKNIRQNNNDYEIPCAKFIGKTFI